MEDQHSPNPPIEGYNRDEDTTEEPTETYNEVSEKKENEGRGHEREGRLLEDSRDEEDDSQKDDEDNQKEVEHSLLQEETITIEIQSEEGNRATLPLSDKKNQSDEESKKKPSKYLFPVTRMKIAWAKSSTICEFFVRATFIIFSTLGWMFCIGGIPFISLALLIIGSIYVDDCKIQPNIPVYLIVAGAFGTVQHFIAIWTKYLPRESQGYLKNYRSYCVGIDCLLQLFLAIWFVLGCIWVYGVYNDVEYRDKTRNEYCNKTLYLFAFWILNFSFMIMAFLCAITLGLIVCIVASPKDKEKIAY
ncbi:uncharacterized protein NPIL_495251 [Nephila pilipes]|uniref:Uncharacterized protein n=1 Tax=Nephila pilipes TaxID=299642 RepID=A0A8X6MFP9_NEPPI|nr:uncharacterized protein NPIL_495251 [Nephila pilipes]